MFAIRSDLYRLNEAHYEMMGEVDALQTGALAARVRPSECEGPGVFTGEDRLAGRCRFTIRSRFRAG